MTNKEPLQNKSLEGTSTRQKLLLLQTSWLKSFKSPIPYASILPHLYCVDFRDEDIVCRFNDKITDYYLLVEGVVNSFETKQGLLVADYISQIRQPQFVGESVYSPNTHRSYTWKTTGPARCCRIDAKTLLELVSDSVAEYNSITLRLSTILGVDFSYLLKFELYKKMTFRSYTRNVNVAESNQKSGNKSVFLILEGECKLSIKNDFFKFNNQRHTSGYQQHILNLCTNELVGVQPYFENEYRYDYIVTSSSCDLIEMTMKDIRESCYHFPQEMLNRMRAVYDSHSKVLEKAMAKMGGGGSVEASLLSDAGKGKSELEYPSRRVKRFLREACMHMPAVNKVKRERKSPEPSSAFIPLKKKKETVVTEFRRKDWMSYIKLPFLNRVQE